MQKLNFPKSSVYKIFKIKSLVKLASISVSFMHASGVIDSKCPFNDNKKLPAMPGPGAREHRDPSSEISFSFFIFTIPKYSE